MYKDAIRRPPKNAADLWKKIEDEFSFIEDIFKLPFETEEDAINRRYRPRLESIGGLVFPVNGALLSIKSRGAHAFDQRKSFYNLGRRLLPRVRRGVRARRLTPVFVHQWATLSVCQGFILAQVLDDTDSFGPQRGQIESQKGRSRLAQKAWASRCYEALKLDGMTFGRAADFFSSHVNAMLALPEDDFQRTPYAREGRKWLEDVRGKKKKNKGKSSTSYDTKNLTRADRENAKRSVAPEDHPPVDFFVVWTKTRSRKPRI